MNSNASKTTYSKKMYTRIKNMLLRDGAPEECFENQCLLNNFITKKCIEKHSPYKPQCSQWGKSAAAMLVSLNEEEFYVYKDIYVITRDALKIMKKSSNDIDIVHRRNLDMNRISSKRRERQESKSFTVSINNAVVRRLEVLQAYKMHVGSENTSLHSIINQILEEYCNANDTLLVRLKAELEGVEKI